MAHSLSAEKRVRQNAKRRSLNRWRKRQFRIVAKEFLATVLHGTFKEAEVKFQLLCKTLDQVAVKGTIHKNTAARYKSRLAARLNAKKAMQAA